MPCRKPVVLGARKNVAHRADGRTHQASAIEHDPYGLAALGLILPGDQGAAARGGGPADVAQVVAFAVFAEALEVAAQAALASLAQLEIDLAAAREKDLLLLGGAQHRVDAGTRLGEVERLAQRSASPRGER